MASEKSDMDKKHVSVAITGHVDSGKSTVTGRLLTLLGGVSERELEKLKAEAAALGKESFIYAFVMDKQKDERARGITIACATKEFFTPNFHYTIIDAPGHRDFVKNMLGGASQADVAVLMVPAEGGFTTAIAAGDHASKEVQGQTRQHARLLNLLGVKQLIVGVNKMDDGTVNWSEARFNEVRDEMRNMLIKVGWAKDFVENCVPVIPMSGWKGDNLLTKSDNMPWWKGVDVKQDVKAKDTVHVETLFEALDKYATVPKRRDDVPLRMPLSGCFKIKGVGDVITGRLEQGKAKDGDEVVFLPRHTDANPCVGKVFSIEMHHKKIPTAGAGDNVGINIKGLTKENMPENGDIMILKSDKTLKPAKSFTIQAQILECPNPLKVGYCPVACVRTAKCAAKLVKINWVMHKSLGKEKVTDATEIKAGYVAELVFEPQQQFVVEKYGDSEGLGRVGLLEGNTLVMLGKVTDVVFSS
jgi:elongation factor 1-alpha